MTHSNIFPLMMQVASKTIELDLVKMNLMYLDYTYGDTLTQKRIKKIKSIYNKL